MTITNVNTIQLKENNSVKNSSDSNFFKLLVLKILDKGHSHWIICNKVKTSQYN